MTNDTPSTAPILLLPARASLAGIHLHDCTACSGISCVPVDRDECRDALARTQLYEVCINCGARHRVFKRGNAWDYATKLISRDDARAYPVSERPEWVPGPSPLAGGALTDA